MVTSWTWLSRTPALVMRTNFGLRAHLVDVGAARVTHRGAQAAGELVQDRDDAALVRHAAFDAFRHELLDLGRGVLEVAVARAVRLRHRAERAHAAIRLVRSALVELDFARRFFGAGEQAAHHHAVRARDDGLGDVAGEADAAVGDQRHAVRRQRRGDVGDRGDLRHADARDDAGRADRARADADLDRIRAGVDQRQRRLGRHDVAGDDLLVRPLGLDALDRLDHAAANGRAPCRRR